MRIWHRSCGWAARGGACVLLAVAALAQHSTSIDLTATDGGIKQPTETVFEDDFSETSLDHAKWGDSVNVKIETAATGDGLRSVARLARLNRSDSFAELRSAIVPLSAVHDAELRFAVYPDGAVVGDSLLVEYLAGDGQWRVLERVVSDGRRSASYLRRFRDLPGDALHDRFRFRFRADLAHEGESWLIANVSVVSRQPACAVRVQSRPAGGVNIGASCLDGGRKLDGATPFTRSVTANSPIRLAAPPKAGELTFSHWAVDGLIQANRSRVLTLAPRGDVEIEAHYRSWVSGRAEACVTTYAIPDPNVPIALGLAPDSPYTDSTVESGFRCLTGETILLSAPARTENMVFVGWVVDARMLPGDEPTLARRVTGDETILAEYALQGDMNGDGALDEYDVDVYLEALVDPLGYTMDYPDLDRVKLGDINADGSMDVLDVEFFIELMIREHARP